ncbi:NAD(P)-dependent alcohol dehydrogenase [Sphaerisporangium corydalis]|uniref:NAD(P)-dependent alcohol dehydrogenase n=1 Tax=Sphaerisporangium corydalis TaxID=1441875 RepID=A0ABV9EQ92_9ACTN|nr:NAD(P)-dependent alcohol dehydrogenase [Sphaerisporangium corydalis]
MKAIIQAGYGSPDELELTDVDKPVAKDGELLIRVHAASVNHGDQVILSGVPYVSRLAFGLPRPKYRIRGRDFAGTVESVGANVRRFRAGDEVYAEIETGTFAEYACVPEDVPEQKPANLTFEQAATMPVAAATALQALRDHGRVRPGQRVLVNGASGGVGTFAVQVARSFGAEVTGVCGTRNVDLVRSLGAAEVIDYTKEDFTRSGRHWDVILDLAGNHSLADLRRALTPRGTLVLSSATGGRWFGPLGRLVRARVLSPFVRQNVRTFMTRTNPKDLAELRRLAESGEITPAIDRTYPLSEVPEAMRYFGEGHARAKIVITI